MKSRKQKPEEEEIPSRVSSSRRLSLQITDDNRIDWEHTSERNKARFAEVVANDPDALEAIGLAATPAEGEEGDSPSLDAFSGISEANVGAALDAITAINRLGFSLMTSKMLKHPFFKNEKGKPVGFKVDDDILVKAFQLTPEQHKELDPRGARLANKYSPEWLKKNNDALAFGGMYLAYMTQNAKMALGAQLQRDMATAKEMASQRKVTQPPPVNGHDKTPPPSEPDSTGVSAP